MNYLPLYLKELQKEQTKPSVRKKKTKTNTGAKINEKETKMTIEKINEPKSSFKKKITLASL